MLQAPLLKSGLPVICWTCPACREAAAFRQAAGSKAAINQILIFREPFDLQFCLGMLICMASQKLLLRCRVAVVGEWRSPSPSGTQCCPWAPPSLLNAGCAAV